MNVGIGAAIWHCTYKGKKLTKVNSTHKYFIKVDCTGNTFLRSAGKNAYTVEPTKNNYLQELTKEEKLKYLIGSLE